MKNRMTAISIATVASLLIVMLMPIIITPAHALPADAMWVDPSTVTLGQDSIGTKFNVTVSLNMTEAIFAYDFQLDYNQSLLNCTRGGWTAGSTSQYTAGHTTIAAGPSFNLPGSINGTVSMGESLLGNDFIPGPRNGSLCWVEFQVLNFTAFMPPSGNLTTTIALDYPDNTAVLAQDGSTSLNLNSLGNTSVIMTPEFPYLLILPIFMGLTLGYAIFNKRRLRPKLK